MLDTHEHARIIADFERVCTVAGIQGHFLHESMTKHCGQIEVTWVRRFWHYKITGNLGLVLEGITRPDTRCQAIAAALLRNFIDARVVPLNSLLDDPQEGLSPTVLLVPNLYVSVMGKIPSWKVQGTYDLLLERATKNKLSVVYVENLDKLVTVYGAPFRDFLDRFELVHD